MKEFAELAARIAEVERRQNGMFRHGTVEEVDAAKQIVRLRIGGSEQEPFISPWVPYAQIAGALKVHTPPSKGQQMTLLSPTGDFRQAVVLPMTWSDQNPSPSDKQDEHVLTYGSVRVTLKEKLVEIKVGNATLTVKDDEVFAVVGGKRIGVADAAVYSVGTTRLGLGSEGEKNTAQPKVVTDAGPAPDVEAKV